MLPPVLIVPQELHALEDAASQFEGVGLRGYIRNHTAARDTSIGR